MKQSNRRKAALVMLIYLSGFVLLLWTLRPTYGDGFSAEIGNLPPESVIWYSGHEVGNTSDWYMAQDEAIFNTGTGQVTITDTLAYSGTHSLALSIKDANGSQEQAARIFRWADDPDDAYYSAWFYFPDYVEVPIWWNVFQFKSVLNNQSLPTWVLNVGSDGAGQMYFYLWDGITSSARGGWSESDPTIPIGEWVHVEMWLQKSETTAGNVSMWMNGVLLHEFANVQTAYDDNVQWSLNNYSSSLMPFSVTIYVDDAAITSQKVGVLNSTEPTAIDLQDLSIQSGNGSTMRLLMLIGCIVLSRWLLVKKSAS